MTALTEIRLRNFRSYDGACLNGLAPSFVVLIGPNGVGKTNFLEAVSLLSPGKGLRNADSKDFQNIHHIAQPWGVSAKVNTSYGPITIGTERDPIKDRRVVHIQGEKIKNQTQLTEYLSCLWLTPQMDRLFIDAAATRRRFLDRLVFTFDSGHAGRMTRYENALSQRSRLLKEGRIEPVWLDSLEMQMAESGVAVAAARADFLMKLQHVCRARGGADFPVAELDLAGALERSLLTMSALQVEDDFKKSLHVSRAEDAVYGGAAKGPHKTDFLVTYADKKMPAGQCSTGEQKALLIGIVLAQADLIASNHGAPPILLLDEVAAHLDSNRRAALFENLSHIGGQVWMTGTDKVLFDGIGNKASFFPLE